MQRVVHIGYNKTGTQTCIKAFEILGYNVATLFPIEYKKGWDSPDIQRELKCKTAYAEHPWREFYTKFDELEDTKFIFTQRADNVEAALSCFYHILKRGGRRMWNPLEQENLDFISNEVIHRNLWNREIYNYFKDKRDRILIINFATAEGWEEICKFLDKDIPDIPFPHMDKGEYDRSGADNIRRYLCAARLDYRNIKWE